MPRSRRSTALDRVGCFKKRVGAVGATFAKGRSKGDTPEIDGAVYVEAHRPSAKQRPSRSSGQIPTICTGRRSGSDRGQRRSPGEALSRVDVLTWGSTISPLHGNDPTRSAILSI